MTLGTLLQSMCPAPADDCPDQFPSTTCPAPPSYAAEDRFIGVADYKAFFHASCGAGSCAPNTAAETRYRRALQSRMGLGGGGGLMRFLPSPCERGEKEGDDGEREVGALLRVETATEATHEASDVFCTPPCTPVRGTLESFPVRQRAASALSTPKPATVFRGEWNDHYHTPTRPLRGLGSVHQGSRTPGGLGEVSGGVYNFSQRGDARWGTPVATSVGMHTPVPASRCSDVSISYTTSPQLGRSVPQHSSLSPQLRTPVRHDSDLLSTQLTGESTCGVPTSHVVSPVSRRASLYLHHATPRCQGVTCDRVLSAEGLSLVDAQGRENFSPVCWGHMGAVIALEENVYLWQESGKTHSLLQAPAECGLVTAVDSSKRPTERGNVYTAIGMQNGVIVLLSHHLRGDASLENGEVYSVPVDVVLEKTEYVALKNHTAHVSTLHVVGRFLYAGCMDGLLTVHNLYNASIVWQNLSYYYSSDLCVALSDPTDCQIKVGAPIYKLEVTPDQQHIAVGTTSNLFVYQASHIGAESRARRRTVVSGASRPVRAFCWWARLFNTSGDSAGDEAHKHVGKCDFGHTVLLYADGADGSVLSVYSVGSRCVRATHCLPAPILAILSSDISEEVLVSMDVHNRAEGRGAGRGVASARGGRRNEPSGDGRDRPRQDDRWLFYDFSSDDEGDFSHVSYVDQHVPLDAAGLGRSDSDGRNGGGDAVWRPWPPPRPRPNFPRDSADDAALLQLFWLRSGGAALERRRDFAGLQRASVYTALSPDNSLMCTAGDEMTLRIWRAFKPKRPERAFQFDFR